MEFIQRSETRFQLSQKQQQQNRFSFSPLDTKITSQYFRTNQYRSPQHKTPRISFAQNSMAEKPEPVKVLYCPLCSLPAEYCEFGPDFEKCKPWLIINAPELYPDLLKGTPFIYLLFQSWKPRSPMFVSCCNNW